MLLRLTMPHNLRKLDHCTTPLQRRFARSVFLSALCRYTAPISRFSNEPVAFVEQKESQVETTNQSFVIRHTTDGDWCEVTDCSTGKRGRVPASTIQEVKETSGAAPPTTAPEKKKGYTYSSLPALTGGPKRKIYKQPKKR